MTQSELTKEEVAWVNKVNRLLAKCPSERIGFYTIGDFSIHLYDKTKKVDDVSDVRDAPDFCICVGELQADLGTLDFPNAVHATVG